MTWQNCPRLVLVCTIALVTVVLWQCGQTEQPTRGRERDSAASAANYVGGARCAECHAEESAAWAASHHDLAMQEVGTDTVMGDFGDVSASHFGEEARFWRDGARFLVNTLGADGVAADFEVAYTFGVTPLQQYLVEFDDGRLQTLPWCWDARPAADGGQRWFHIYPNEPIPPGDALHWTGPNQNWNFMCAECHSTGLVKNYDPDLDRYDTRWAELDVSCEACHGPGSTHSAEPEAMRMPADMADHGGGTWMRPADSPTSQRSAPPAPDRQLDACARCHSRRRQLIDGAPAGTPFLDSHTPELLLEGLYHADGQILDEVYVYGSFLQSRMHGAGVRCNDCHDPHSLTLKGEGNALCASCHDPRVFDHVDHHLHPAGGPGTACIDCHMPTRTYMGVDVRRDHSLRIPRPDLSQQLDTPNACNQCHDDKSPAWAARLLAEHFPDGAHTRPHYGKALAHGRARAPGAAAELAALVGDAEQPAIVRATALNLMRHNPGAEIMPALAQALSDADGLVRASAVGLADLLPGQTRAQVALPAFLDPLRSVRVEAARVLVGFPTGQLQGEQLQIFNGVMQDYLNAQSSNAERPSAQLNLGIYFATRAERDRAEAAYRRALNLDPRYVAAAINLADLYRSLEREADAEAELRAILKQVPDSSTAQHSLGLTLVRTGRQDQALLHLEKAARYDPGNPRFALVYAVALEDAGSRSVAISVLEQALQRHGYDFDLSATRVRYLAAEGEIARARAALLEMGARFGDDPRYRDLGQSLAEALR